MNLQNFETQIGLSNWHFNELYYVLLDALIQKKQKQNNDPKQIPSVSVSLIS